MTKILAHRGANKHAPQNTIPAFLKAIELGADGVENDVHLTKDGELVICHNYTIDETSDGKGNISDYTLEELKKFDFGSYFSPDFAGTKIPTLHEFLEIANHCKPMDSQSGGSHASMQRVGIRWYYHRHAGCGSERYSIKVIVTRLFMIRNQTPGKRFSRRFIFMLAMQYKKPYNKAVNNV